MKTKTFIGMIVMLMTLAGMTACSNDENPVDNPEANAISNKLYGEWLLQGYGSDSNFTDVVHGHLILKEDGTFEGGLSTNYLAPTPLIVMESLL